MVDHAWFINDTEDTMASDRLWALVSGIKELGDYEREDPKRESRLQWLVLEAAKMIKLY